MVSSLQPFSVCFATLFFHETKAGLLELKFHKQTLHLIALTPLQFITCNHYVYNCSPYFPHISKINLLVAVVFQRILNK